VLGGGLPGWPMACEVAQVPPVDQWPRVVAATAQAPGGLRESARQCFEDGDSPGQCGNGGAVEAGQNDGTRRL
jgi:hypothetical protein